MLRPLLNSLGIWFFLLSAAATLPVHGQVSTGGGRDPRKVALLPLDCERGIEGEICAVLGDSVALAISESTGLEPITPGDLEVMMGAQALSELSSCGGDACFVGDESLRIDAAWLLGGTVTRLGDKTRVVMRLVDLQRGAIIERGEVTVEEGDEEGLDTAVRRLTVGVLAKRGLFAPTPEGDRLSAVEVAEEEPPYLLYAGGGTAALGIVALGAAGVLGSLAYLDVQSAETAAALGSSDGIARHAADARTKAWGADMLLATGGLLVVGGAVLALVGAL